MASNIKSKQRSPYSKQNQFIAVCYLPPENSVFYRDGDIDIFESLEESICKYHDEGSVYVIGD